MRLALAVGRLDVDHLAREMTARELAEWEAFDRLEGGIGGRGDWQRTALLASLYAERNRDPKRRSAPFSLKEFLPWIERAPMAQRLRAGLAHLVRGKKGG